MGYPGELKRALGAKSQTSTSPPIKVKFQGWRGKFPAFLGFSCTCSTIQLAVFHSLKNLAAGSSKREDHIQLNPCFSYFSGALSGSVAAVAIYPILPSKLELKVHQSTRSPYFDYIRTRGPKGLYVGLSSTLISYIPYAGLQLGTYDTLKRWIMRSSSTSSINNDNSLSSFQSFVCGLAAGTCANLLCHPLSEAKRKLRVEGLKRHPTFGARIEHQTYKNMTDALRRIFQAEGWDGLYKHIVPKTMLTAPAGAVIFVTYEWLVSHST